ncbi:MAG: FixH family protein [Kofleriaceae bacterium]
MSPTIRWLVAIVALLLANMIAIVVLAVSAHDGGGAQVIPDYYGRAVRHDQTLATAARSTALGWHVEATLEQGAIIVEARDAQGAPLVGQVRVTGYPRAHAARAFEIGLDPIRPGTYRAARANDRGWHDLTISIATAETQDTQHFATEAP